VKGIVAKVCNFTIKNLCYPKERKLRPVTHVDAQFSLPYAVAVSICKNRAGVDEFKKDVLGDPEVLTLAEKVTWELDPEAEEVYPKAYPATLIATLKDGRQFQSHVDYPKGDPENPATLGEIVDKFTSLTEKYFDQPKREKVVEAIKDLEKIDNIAYVADLLR
jgi:2-methylcitrate dehydratase PrpD